MRFFLIFLIFACVFMGGYFLFFNEGGEIFLSESVSAPTGLSSGIKDYSMLVWDANKESVSGYKIYWGDEVGNYNLGSKEIGLVPRYSLSELGLKGGKTYYIAVSALKDGGESAKSDYITATITMPLEGMDYSSPVSPSGLSAVVAGGDVLLSWDANKESDLAGYYVYHGKVKRSYGEPVFVSGKTTHTVSGLEKEMNYYFSVTAADVSGNESGFSSPEVVIFVS